VVTAIFAGRVTAALIAQTTTAHQALIVTLLATVLATQPDTNALPIAGCSKTTRLALF
jgi:hypothetical protein